jgi:hypothetical protein
MYPLGRLIEHIGRSWHTPTIVGSGTNPTIAKVVSIPIFVIVDLVGGGGGMRVDGGGEVPVPRVGEPLHSILQVPLHLGHTTNSAPIHTPPPILGLKGIQDATCSLGVEEELPIFVHISCRGC